jgi:hypothetical protein
LIIKFDSLGKVQWQKVLGPSTTTQALFNAVQQTSDGGYIVTGDTSNPTQILVVKFYSSGNVQWKETFNAANSESVIQTSDGGYLVAGLWENSTNSAECCTGALLLKLGSTGSVQWEKAYTDGVYCFFNGYSETCVNLSAFIYSLHQASGGDYLLAGDANLVPRDSAPIEEWLAEVDSNGNVLWQHLYYQVNAATGRPLGEYFASATVARDGGFLGVVWTENYQNGLGQLYVVKTDSSGLCGKTCSEVHTATPLRAINPGLIVSSVSLPISTTASIGVGSPANTRATSVVVKQDC